MHNIFFIKLIKYNLTSLIHFQHIQYILDADQAKTSPEESLYDVTLYLGDNSQCTQQVSVVHSNFLRFHC